MTYNPNQALLRLCVSLLMLLLLIAYGVSISGMDVPIDLLARRQPPSTEDWFGTDSLGRDLWLRCFQGMTTSLQIGLTATFSSGFLAMLAASLCSLNKTLDYLVRGVMRRSEPLIHFCGSGLARDSGGAVSR